MAIATSMAILGAAAVGAVGSVAAGAMQSKAAGKAADAQVQAAELSAGVQRDAAQQSRIDSFPWALAGAQALYTYMDELGIPRPQTPILPDLTQGPFGVQASGTSGTTGGATGTTAQPTSAIAMTNKLGFQKTPGYEFQVSEGRKGVTNSLSALGMKNSGLALKSLEKYGQGVANQEYGTYLNRLASMAGMGQTQTNQTNALTSNAASAIGQTYQDAGAARASGYIGSANAWGNAIANTTNQFGNALGQLAYQPKTATPTGWWS